MNGFLNILKPPGMTSAAVVSIIRRLTGEKRVGHAGTLDPDAAGILPVMVGKAARLFDYLVDKEKTYVAEVAFGQSTDTQDASGTVLETGDRYPSLEEVRSAALRLTGDIVQRPSMYSAIKKDGKPLYSLARAGVEIDVPERTVHVTSIDVTDEMPNHGFLMTVRCGRGTYIRSICDDLGKLCGCPAHMRFLLRSQTGAFDLSSAITLEELQQLADAGSIPDAMVPMDAPLKHLPMIHMPQTLSKQVVNGVKLPALGDTRALADESPVRIYLNDQFWGICAKQENELVWRAQIAPENKEEL